MADGANRNVAQQTIYEVMVPSEHMAILEPPVDQQQFVQKEQQEVEVENDGGPHQETEEINFTERDLLPYFKKAHIHSRAINEYLATGKFHHYCEDNNKKNALRQAAALYRRVKGELYRHGSEREYQRYGLRIVIHDDEPQRRLDIITKCHIDSQGAHLGMNTTLKKVQQVYYWQGISSHVKMYLKKCTVCKDRSKFSAEEWFEEERKNLGKKVDRRISKEIRDEIRNLGRVKKATPPETFFIVNAERKIDMENFSENAEMLIDSNNIEYVVETLGYNEEGQQLKEICHVLNVGDIIPLPDRFRSREIENYLKYDTFPEDFSVNQRSGLRGPAQQYTLVDDELYHESSKTGQGGLKLVIHDDQPAMKVKVMVECHIDEDGNHLGLNRTMKKISESYYWVGLSVDVKKFMLHCKVCSAPKDKKQDKKMPQYLEEVKRLKAIDGDSVQEEENQVKEMVSFEDVAEGEGVHEVGQGAVVDADEGNTQMIQFVQPENEGVSEITVAVVNGEVVEQGNVETVETNKEVCEEQQAVAAIETPDVSESSFVESEQVNAAESVSSKSDDAIVELVETIAENEDKVKLEGQTNETLEDPAANESINSSDVTVSEKPAVESSYYKDVVFVPEVNKTRAFELFLAKGTVSQGLSKTKLTKEVSSYQLIDGILYRRPSRYKGRQIVVHDDNPQVKLKIIEECHKKPNGDHCSELITSQTVGYKYYWDEMKCDVHRFYLRCRVCVEEGKVIRTRKKVSTLEERQKKFGKMKKKSKRTETETLGIVDQVKLGSIENEDSNVVEVHVEFAKNEHERMDTGDESDIEIHLSDSDTEEKPSSVVQEDLFRMTFVTSLEEDQIIREVFATNAWQYTQESQAKWAGQAGDTPQDGRELYQITLHVTRDQEEAIRGILNLSTYESTPLSTATPHKLSIRGRPKVVTKAKPSPVEQEVKSTPKATKRKIIETPVVASPERRSRREVKRPRRFSPEPDERRKPNKPIPSMEKPVSGMGAKTEELESQIKSPKSSAKQIPAKTPVSKAVAESDSVPLPGSMDVSSVKKPSRGRGRPRKTSQVTVSIIETVDVTEEEVDEEKEIDEQVEDYTEIKDERDEIEEEDVDDYEMQKDEEDENDEEEEEEGEEENESIEDELKKIAALLDDTVETMEVVSVGNEFMCSLCEAKFPTEKDCVQHGIKNKCLEECGLCGKLYKKSQLVEYMSHVAEHEKGDKHKCDICDKEFFDGHQIKVHRRLHEEVKEEKCATCEEEFDTSFQLAAHMLRVHEETNMFKCDICHAKFVNIKFLRAEKLFDGELSYFKCIMCSK